MSESLFFCLFPHLTAFVVAQAQGGGGMAEGAPYLTALCSSCHQFYLITLAVDLRLSVSMILGWTGKCFTMKIAGQPIHNLHPSILIQWNNFWANLLKFNLLFLYNVSVQGPEMPSVVTWSYFVYKETEFNLLWKSFVVKLDPDCRGIPLSPPPSKTLVSAFSCCSCVTTAQPTSVWHPLNYQLL